MARSHHRKKHKEHLRQFKHTQESGPVSTAASRSRGTVVFGVMGAIIGLAVAYFATQGSLLWMGAGLAAGAVLGYYIGRSVDSSK